MKRFFIVIVFLFLCHGLGVAEETKVSSKPSLKDEMFVVESSGDTSESLNRISGKYDIGFSLPFQSYESPSHYKPGPFSGAESHDSQ